MVRIRPISAAGPSHKCPFSNHAASAASAHDFFLIPDEFRTAAGSVGIHATVGSSLPKAENTVAADRVDRMIALGAGSPQVRIVGATATALDVEVTAARLGLLLTAVRTKKPPAKAERFTLDLTSLTFSGP